MPAAAPKVAARKVALTDRSLQALKPAPKGKRAVVWDALMPGLAVRVTDKGKRSFYAVRRRAGQSQPTWALLGSYPVMTLAEARTAAREALGALIKGEDPMTLAAAKRRAQDEATRQRDADTFAAVAARFVAWYRETPGKGGGMRRRWKDTADVIARDLTSAWGDRPIASITRRDVTEVIEEIRSRGGERPAAGTRRKAGGPYAARHAFAAARLVFGWAFNREIIPADPCGRIKGADLHGAPEARDRVLSDDELRPVWCAAERTPYPFGPLVKLLLLTGARLREVAEASWEEIDVAAATLTVPTSRMKMKVAHVIPLTPAALAIISELPRQTGGDYLFSTTGGRRPISGFSKLRQRFDKEMVKVLDAEGRRARAHFTIHDVRRTVRTNLSSIGVLPIVAEMVIGHQQQGIAKVYDLHRYDAEKRDALEHWSARLLAIVGPQPEPAAPVGNVVPLPARARG